VRVPRPRGVNGVREDDAPFLSPCYFNCGQSPRIDVLAFTVKLPNQLAHALLLRRRIRLGQIEKQDRVFENLPPLHRSRREVGYGLTGVGEKAIAGMKRRKPKTLTTFRRPYRRKLRHPRNTFGQPGESQLTRLRKFELQLTSSRRSCELRRPLLLSNSKGALATLGTAVQSLALARCFDNSFVHSVKSANLGDPLLLDQHPIQQPESFHPDVVVLL